MKKSIDCDICSFLKDEKDLVFQTDYWKVFVMDEQSYLGRCVVPCKRHCPSLSELTNEEWTDFKEVIKKLEGAVKKAFGADLANWSCLMNNAFRKAPFNSHVHWHFRPRYKNPVEFSKKSFTDPDFGEHYNRDRRDIVSSEVLRRIVQEIKISTEGQSTQRVKGI